MGRVCKRLARRDRLLYSYTLCRSECSKRMGVQPPHVLESPRQGHESSLLGIQVTGQHLRQALVAWKEDINHRVTSALSRWGHNRHTHPVGGVPYTDGGPSTSSRHFRDSGSRGWTVDRADGRMDRGSSETPIPFVTTLFLHVNKTP